jgi:hypothetical protein
MYSPDGGTPAIKYIAAMQVQLWQKSPMDITYLGEGLTDSAGYFVVEFSAESPSVMIEDGKIHNVFLKVLYSGEVLIGDLDPSSGSFD